MREVVFWQSIVSPHMANLANSLGALGGQVTYVAAAEMTPDRLQQGWTQPALTHARLRLANGPKQVVDILTHFSSEAIHLTQGVRGNGAISAVVPSLRQRQARWGAIMETIDERFGQGPFKRLVYAWHLGRAATRPDVILAIGAPLKPWLIARGFPAEKIFEFAYFLASGPTVLARETPPDRVFRVGFAGRLIQRKRVDVLIEALAGLLQFPFELIVIGAGPLEERWREQGVTKLGRERFHLLGQLTMTEARACIQTLDCLILPSDHDGWGAVVSEALMAGVPALCSDACGAVTAVRASGVGGVFPKGDVAALRALLEQAFARGRPSQEARRRLSAWAQCLGAEAGAQYLRSIIDSIDCGGSKPTAPWESAQP